MKQIRTYSSWCFRVYAVIFFLYGIFLHGASQAKLIEEQIEVPVKLKNVYGKSVEQTIRVTVWRDDTNPLPMPALVLNHGRAADALGRSNMGRARFSNAAKFFVELGFIVAVPTRVGYGVTGGEDIEDSGSCSAKHYPPAYKVSADQTIATLVEIRKFPGVDGNRSVIVGQSFGGTTAIAVAAKNLPGISAAINFAGGGGGNPKTQPEQPCAPDMLGDMFGEYGRTARIPTLWIYTENDKWMGSTYPQKWFHAFEAAGGLGEFVLFPPYGEDGHSLFVKFPDVWQPRVKEFLDKNGFRGPMF